MGKKKKLTAPSRGSRKETAKLENGLKTWGEGRSWQHLASCLEPSCLPTRSCDKCPPTAGEPQLSPEGSERAGWQPEACGCRCVSPRAGNLIISAGGAGASGSTAALGRALEALPAREAVQREASPHRAAGLETHFHSLP